MAEVAIRVRLVGVSETLSGIKELNAALNGAGKQAGASMGAGQKATKGFSDTVTAAGRSFSGFGDSLRKSAAEGEQAFASLGRGISTASRALFSLPSLIASLGLGVMAKQVIDSSLALERMRTSLTVATGSTQAAAREFAFMVSEANRLGLSVETAGRDFGQLAAAARGTALEGKGARDIFTAVAEATTALGLSTDQTSGAFVAIQQIISKGTVSAEELRGQLGERLPGAFQIAAKAMGTTTAELGKMLASGAIASDVFLPKFAAALRDQFGAAAEQAADRFDKNWTRVGNKLLELQGMAGAAGFTAALNDMAKAALDAASGPGARAFATFIGQTMAAGVRAATGALTFLRDNLRLVEGALAGAGAAAVAFGLTQIPAMVAAIGVATRALAGMAAFLLTNPFILVATAVGVAIGAIVAYRNEVVSLGDTNARVIDVVAGGYEYLRDVTRATFGLMTATVKASIETVGGYFDYFANTLQTVAGNVAAQVGAVIEAMTLLSEGEIKKAGEALGKTFQTGLADGLRAPDVSFVDNLAKALQGVDLTVVPPLERAGQLYQAWLDALRTQSKQAGAAYGEAMTDVGVATDNVGKSTKAATDKLNDLLQKQGVELDALKKQAGGLGDAGAMQEFYNAAIKDGARSADDARQRFAAQYRQFQTNQRAIEDLTRSTKAQTKAHEDLIASDTKMVEAETEARRIGLEGAAKLAAQIDDINRKREEEINLLGTLTAQSGELEGYEERLRRINVTYDAQVAALEKTKQETYDTWTGAKAAASGYFKTLEEDGKRAGEFVVSGVLKPMETAIAGFFTTGKLSFGDFFDAVKAGLAKLAAQDLVSAIGGIFSDKAGGGGIVGSVLNGVLGSSVGTAIGSAFGGATSGIGSFLGSATSGIGDFFSGLFADGGRVSGPGGPREDRVLARVSPGEYIVNAQSAAAFGPVLDAINGAPRFASGGRVDYGGLFASLAGRGAGSLATSALNSFYGIPSLGSTLGAFFGAGLAPAGLGFGSLAGGAAFSAGVAPVVGGVVNAAAGTAATAGLALSGLATAGIGTIVGLLASQFLGSILGGKPSVGPNAAARVKIAGGKAGVADANADNGGDPATAAGLAGAVAGVLNALSRLTGQPLQDVGIGPIGYFPSQGGVFAGPDEARQVFGDDTQGAIAYMVQRALGLGALGGIAVTAQQLAQAQQVASLGALAGGSVGPLVGAGVNLAGSMNQAYGKLQATGAGVMRSFQHGGQAIFTAPEIIGVGENGPERVTVEPLAGGPGRAGGGSAVHVHFDAPVFADAFVARRLARDVRREMDRGRTVIGGRGK